MGQRTENLPIEFVAARLRELRRTALVLSSSPDLVPHRDDELRRLAARYDELLMIAAAQVGLELEALPSDGSGLTPNVRRLVEHGLVNAGWVLDFDD